MNSRDNKPNADSTDVAFDAIRNAPVPELPPPELVASTIRVLQTAQTQPDVVRLRRRRETVFRIARFSGITVAASALIAVGVWLAATNGRAQVAFGDVIKNVEQSTSVTFRQKQKIGRQPEIELQWHLRGQRARIEMAGVMAFVADLDAKRTLRLDLMDKRAVKSDIDKRAAAEFANPIEQLRQAKPDDAEQIGEEMLGDVETVVYRINHVDLLGIKGKAEMKVWVAPKTKLPVRIEIRDTQRTVSLSFDRFEWNKPLDAKLFDIDAPDGFTIDDTLGVPPLMN